MRTLEELRNDPEATIQQICQAKFRHLSNQQLVDKINRAPDFGWDDEGVELSRRIKSENLEVERNYRDQLVIVNPERV